MRSTLAIAALVLAVIIASPLSAADKNAATSGVYLTSHDFVCGFLTAEGQRNSSSHEMKLHDTLFGKPYIEVLHNGELRRYAKDQIWGYRDFDGKSYRFVNGRTYEIREASAVIIYILNDVLAGRKGRVRPDYYFSTDADSFPVRLTLMNLKMAFPENHGFHDYLDMSFRSDAELTRFDTFHKMYKVNHLLISSAGVDP
jgi:hypothetical protein